MSAAHFDGLRVDIDRVGEHLELTFTQGLRPFGIALTRSEALHLAAMLTESVEAASLDDFAPVQSLLELFAAPEALEPWHEHFAAVAP